MKIFKNKIELLNELSGLNNIAFIPTMGSIHDGHLSLIKKAKKKSVNIIVSIYVNPKQFNTTKNFQEYPRNIKKDITLLKKTKIKYLYLPKYKDIYSFKTKLPIYLDHFSKKLCGKFRPKHFYGVINVVNRFIEIIKPKLIFLGFKDFQQLSLINLHINKNRILTKVIGCSTIRDKNGIALSSRNKKLNKKQLHIASKVFKYLKINKKDILLKNKRKDKLDLKKKLLSFGVTKIQYLEGLNLKTLKKPLMSGKKSNIFIAYYLGRIRLIDNL
ncbi:pantoate--beta-alanine ligase [Pelagibacteraceae bacterium]|nr:pantoate--beta-alanine ligase [Pelagibacteraceae bacterium]